MTHLGSSSGTPFPSLSRVIALDVEVTLLFVLLLLLLLADSETSGGSGVSPARCSVLGVNFTVLFFPFGIDESDDFIVSLFPGL